MIIALAAKFGKLPDEIEKNMSVYWMNRSILMMDAEALDQQRRNDEMERDNRKR